MLREQLEDQQQTIARLESEKDLHANVKVSSCYTCLHVVTRSYTSLHVVTRRYKSLHIVTRSWGVYYHRFHDSQRLLMLSPG